MSAVTWSRRAIIPVAVVFFALQGIGTIVATANRLPFENATGHGDPNAVLKDFLTGGGTALSGPLVVLVILAVLIGLGRLKNRWGTLGLGATVILGAMATVFGAQESIAVRMLQTSPFGWFETMVIVLAWGSVLAAAAIVVISLLMVIGKFRRN